MIVAETSPATIVADPASESTDVSTATLVPSTMASPDPGGTGATDVVLAELVPEVLVEVTSEAMDVESEEMVVVVPDTGTVDVGPEEMVVVVPDSGTVEVELVVVVGQKKFCAFQS